MTALPEQLDELIRESRICEKTDTAHKRLAQYRLLQRKEAEKNKFDSNTDFLMSCHIRVEICRDCLDNIDRIHEFLMRGNQFNYTKFMQDKEELQMRLQQEGTDAWYVHAPDRFGDYGIIGFFAVRDYRAIHYLFSCRTLGMAVKQYG